MDSSTENLLHGEVDELKSWDQDSPTKAQQYVEKCSKHISMRTMSCLSVILNFLLLTSLFIQWGKINEYGRSKYGSLIAEHSLLRVDV